MLESAYKLFQNEVHAVLSTLAPLRSEDVGQLVGLELCCRHHSHQVNESLAMEAPALLKCERFVAVRLGAEKRSDLVKDVAETRSGGKRFEAAHGSAALLHTPMILLQMVIQIAVRPVDHEVPEDIPDGTRVRVMTIRGNTVWGQPGHVRGESIHAVPEKMKVA
jgi:hypothetical protein